MKFSTAKCIGCKKDFEVGEKVREIGKKKYAHNNCISSVFEVGRT